MENESPLLSASPQPLEWVGPVDASVVTAVLDVDTIAAKELNAVPAHFRTEILEGVHGVESVLEETETLVAERLRLLEMELQQIQTKPAYDQAFAKDDGDYVCRPKFRLSFLRAEAFNPKLAAARLVCFLERKLYFFGPECLVRDVRIDDLDETSKEILELGKVQLSPWRDRVDRCVLMDIAVTHGPPPPQDPFAVVKVMFYMSMTLMGDKVTERHGQVILFAYMTTHNDRILDKDYHRRVAESADNVYNWWPFRIKCIHICAHSELRLQPITDLVKVLVGPENRARLRMHVGTYQGCCTTLAQYGIPPSGLPINFHGDGIKRSNHTKWLARRRTKYLASLGGRGSTVSLAGHQVELPSRKDILLGRGRTYYSHQGNVIMRQLLSDMVDTTVERDRRKLTMVLCETLQKWGCRFLQKEPTLGGWEEASPSVVEARIGNFVRLALAKGAQKK